MPPKVPQRDACHVDNPQAPRGAADVATICNGWDHVVMPLPMGLARETIRFQVNHAEGRLLEAKARESGMGVANYVRSRVGLPERQAGRPTVEQLKAEQDQALIGS